MAKELAATANPTKAMTRELERAKGAVRDLTNKEREMVSRHGAMKAAMQQAGINTRQLSQHQRQLKSDLTATTAQLEQQRSKLTQVAAQQKRIAQVKANYDKTMAMRGTMAGYGAAGMATGAAGLYKINSIASVGLDFDAQMSKVQALTRLQKDSAELAMLRQQARDLGASTSFTAMDAAQAQGFLAMSGFNPKQIKAAMPDMLDLAKASGVGLDQTADIASNILSAFKMEAAQMGRVSDTLALTMTTSNVDLNMLAETMKYMGPIANKAGMSLEEAAAAAGLLGNIGIQGSNSGTALRAMLNRLAGPTSKADKLMKSLGVTTKDASGNMLNIVDIMAQVAKQTEKMGNADQLAAYKEIFGEEAASGMAELIGQAGAGGFAKYAAMIRQQSKGVAKEMAAVMGDNARGDLDNMTSAWEDLNIQMLETQNGPLRGLIQQVTSMTQAAGAWMRANPELTAILTKVAAITAVAAAAGGSLLLIVAGLLGPLAMLKFALGGTLVRLGGLFLSTNKTAESMSMFSRIMALNSRMAAPLLAKWAALGNAIKGLSFAKVGAGMNAMLTTITNLPTKIGAMTAATWRYITAQWAASKATAATKFTSMISGIRAATAATSAYVAANGVMGTSMNLLKGAASGTISLLKGGLVGALRLVGQTIAVVGRLLLMNPIGLLVTAIGLAALTIYRYWEPIKAFFSGFFQGLKEGLGPVAAVFTPAFEAMAGALSPLKPIWDGISSALGSAWEWVTNLLTPIKTTQQELDGATNAGKRFGLWLGGLGKSFIDVIADFTKFGADLIDGLIKGISDKWAELKTKIAAMTDLLPDWWNGGSEVKASVENASTAPAVQAGKEGGFAGFYDKGGLIPAGKWGIAGENGPEVVKGPASIISRRHTAAMASAAMLASMPLAAMQPHQDATRTIREQVVPAALRQPADTVRTIREQVMPAELRHPADTARTIREQVMPAELRQPVEAAQTIREQVVPAELNRPANSYSRPGPRIVETPKLAPARGDTNIHISAPIHIAQQPGQSSVDVAQEVRRELDRRERQASARTRASLRDNS
ncbi:phage tail tape measure protein [Aeromonas caviae]|uniref:phage tail tape measure protein n=1 Tax=Aeromonas caviae TaxID=648 RepID=UPI002B466821|nr:phage tail tape measure protein [Aeromonas caviae]